MLKKTINDRQHLTITSELQGSHFEHSLTAYSGKHILASLHPLPKKNEQQKITWDTFVSGQYKNTFSTHFVVPYIVL